MIEAGKPSQARPGATPMLVAARRCGTPKVHCALARLRSMSIFRNPLPVASFVFARFLHLFPALGRTRSICGSSKRGVVQLVMANFGGVFVLAAFRLRLWVIAWELHGLLGQQVAQELISRVLEVPDAEDSHISEETGMREGAVKDWEPTRDGSQNFPVVSLDGQSGDVAAAVLKCRNRTCTRTVRG